jgi:hypothetical protein
MFNVPPVDGIGDGFKEMVQPVWAGGIDPAHENGLAEALAASITTTRRAENLMVLFIG